MSIENTTLPPGTPGGQEAEDWGRAGETGPAKSECLRKGEQLVKSWMEAVRGFVQRVLGKGSPSPEVTAAVQTGTIAGPYRPEEFSVFALARRDGGRIAGLMIAHACDGDGWERTNLRSVISVDLATRLGAIAEE